MKTLCSWDNVACIVDNISSKLDGSSIAGAIIGIALIGAFAFASFMRGN